MCDVARYFVIYRDIMSRIMRYNKIRYIEISYHVYIPNFAGRCSVTIFLTDLDGTVTQHDGNFLAVDGFPFLDGNFLAVDGESNFDGIVRR